MKMRKNTISTIGNKILMSLIVGSSMLTSISPVFAKSTVDATNSGDDKTGNTGNKVHHVCQGGNSLTGMDAEIFKQITPEHDGTIICAQSNGFDIRVSGDTDIRNYHWTAWYKNKLEDDIDRTLEFGNYRGFDNSKIEAWKEQEDAIRKLNNGQFPDASKNYTYPTNTKTGKLDFWADIAGYYSVLGDPQYDLISLDAYQSFSFVTRHEVVRKQYIGPAYSPGTNSDDSDKNNENPPKPKPKPKPCPKGQKRDKNGICKGKGEPPTGGKKPYVPQTNPNIPIMNKDNGVGLGGNYGSYYNPDMGVDGQKNKKGSKQLVDSIPGETYINAAGQWQIITDVYEYDETQEVHVAHADVARNSYATEIAQFEKLGLIKNPGNVNLEGNKVGFWQTKPTYWTNAGTSVIENEQNLPYGFINHDKATIKEVYVNLYKELSNTDKLYTFIHGFPETPGGEKPKNQDKTCVRVDSKKTCSKDGTPIVNVQLDIEKDSAQTQEEVDKVIHHTKSKDEEK